MSEIIYNRKAAIRNTVLYAVFLAIALLVVLTRHSVPIYIVAGLLALWAVGGVTANVRAIRNGFKTDD